MDKPSEMKYCMNRSALKWHPFLVNIAVDPTTKIIYHKMGPLRVALKPKDQGSRSFVMVNGSYYQVKDLLKYCGVE